MKTIPGPVLALLLCPPAVFASEEDGVALGEFSFKSPATAEASAIEVAGKRTSDGAWENFRVRAFGKVTPVPAEKLAALQKAFLNGVMLSSEPGYAETGGRTVYVTFLFGFTSGIVERWILSVNERGDIALEKAK